MSTTSIITLKEMSPINDLNCRLWITTDQIEHNLGIMWRKPDTAV